MLKELESGLAIDKHRTETWQPQRSILLRLLERIALAIERPINWLVGTPQLNPFYHADLIAVFLLLVVGLTGLYLTFFFAFGFDASYHAVSRTEGQLIGRTIRAIHRYAAGAAVIAGLIHAFRLFFMGRFRGPQWLAWVSGVVIMVILWLDGVTGYWLIWDQRAQLLTAGFTNFLRQYTSFGTPFALSLVSAGATGQSWVFLLLIFFMHLLLFIIVALFFWVHILRLDRPRFLPAPYWLIGTGIVLLMVSAAAPVGMLPKAHASLLPGRVRIDPIYLFFLPFVLDAPSGWFWGGLVATVAIATALPWLTFRRKHIPRVTLDQDLCIGCTTCAKDCPYKAITMMPRTDGKPHKLIAVTNPDLCTSCGICIGSCNDLAVSLGNLSIEATREIALARLRATRQRARSGQVKIVFTCERHAAQGARPYLNPPSGAHDTASEAVEVIALPCVATVNPDLLTETLEMGATEVQAVGCPPDDCAHREGNLWMAERLARRRLPRLKRAYVNAPISTAWVPPDAFARAVIPEVNNPRKGTGESGPSLHPIQAPTLRWRHFVPAFALLGLVLGLQIRLTSVPFQPYADQPAVVQIALPDAAEPFGYRRGEPPAWAAGYPLRLVLQVDGTILFEQSYTSDTLFADASPQVFEEVRVAPGEHHVRLSFEDDEEKTSLVLYDQMVMLDPRQVLTIGFEKEPPLKNVPLQSGGGNRPG